MRRLIWLAASAAPVTALAHGEANAHHWWSFDPWVWVPMAAVSLLYLRGISALRARRSLPYPARLPAMLCFATAMAATFFALIWPLDVLGASSLAAHMAQHMLLIAVAAPLFAIAEPAAPLLVGMPGTARIVPLIKTIGRVMRPLLRPGVAFGVHGALVWLWHAPLLFELALRWRWVHVLEHIAFLGSALLFWSALQQARRAGGEGYGVAALWTLATLMHTGLLGALLTFSPRLLYAFYAGLDHAPLAPMEDQQLAGLLMWIPGGLCYLAAGVYFASTWLRDAERRGKRA